jgi:membrane protein DedA with SNARE-associated domain
MAVLSWLFDIISAFCTYIINTTGYVGIFFLMTLESMITPIPSELVMPFAGFLVFDGKLNFWWVVLAGTLGSVMGSVLSYIMGYYGGPVFVKKIGKFFFLNEEHLEMSQKFFHNHGEKTIFISRFIPVVRHLISIPAGMAYMEIKKFLVFTALGSFCWVFILTYAGVKLKEHYGLVHEWLKTFEYLIIALILGVVILWIFLHIRRRKKHTK